ncbi:MAG: hypothetical protein ACREFF_06930 [Candidatus Udaeobacter sp.]
MNRVELDLVSLLENKPFGLPLNQSERSLLQNTKADVDGELKRLLSSPDTTPSSEPDEKKSFNKLLQDIQAGAEMPDDARDALPSHREVEQPDVNSILTEIERTPAPTLSNNPGEPAASSGSPPVVTIVKPVVVKMIHGSATLSPGTKLPMISRTATTVQVRYLDSSPIIPISATDAQ